MYVEKIVKDTRIIVDTTPMYVEYQTYMRGCDITGNL